MQQSHQCQGTVNHEYPANLYAKIESLKYCLISWRTTERSSILKTFEILHYLLNAGTNLLKSI